MSIEYILCDSSQKKWQFHILLHTPTSQKPHCDKQYLLLLLVFRLHTPLVNVDCQCGFSLPLRESQTLLAKVNTNSPSQSNVLCAADFYRKMLLEQWGGWWIWVWHIEIWKIWTSAGMAKGGRHGNPNKHTFHPTYLCIPNIPKNIFRISQQMHWWSLMISVTMILFAFWQTQTSFPPTHEVCPYD